MTRACAQQGAAGSVPVSAFDLDRTALLLDVDGTLIDLAPTPQAVRVPASLKHTLGQLRDRLGGALALVSGRPLEDLDRLFDPLRLPILGGHGAECRLSGTGPVTRSLVPPISPQLKERLTAIAARTPGAIAEEKDYSLALHYRLAPEHEEAIRVAVAGACASWPDVEILPGKAVFEVKPRAFNKGLALRELMRHPPFAGRRPIFMGDDITDESAVAALPEFGGFGFAVGREIPGAEGYFAAPREVRAWLYALLREGREESGV